MIFLKILLILLALLYLADCIISAKLRKSQRKLADVIKEQNQLLKTQNSLLHEQKRLLTEQLKIVRERATK